MHLNGRTIATALISCQEIRILLDPVPRVSNRDFTARHPLYSTHVSRAMPRPPHKEVPYFHYLQSRASAVCPTRLDRDTFAPQAALRCRTADNGHPHHGRHNPATTVGRENRVASNQRVRKTCGYGVEAQPRREDALLSFNHDIPNGFSAWTERDRKSTRLNSSHVSESRMPSSA